jgi:excisionase family DNA binding protein
LRRGSQGDRGVAKGRMTVRQQRRSPFADDGFLTVEEVADAMRVSKMTIYRLIKSGQLAAIQVGKNYRIRESDVDRYLSERSVRVEEEG